jgi:sterol desaturase/sphingolipid hydroxylase (fatty acid hydroxylase superfamily)
VSAPQSRFSPSWRCGNGGRRGGRLRPAGGHAGRAISAFGQSTAWWCGCSAQRPWSAWRLTAAHHGWGLFHLLALPYWAALVLGVIALDLTIYGQHVVFHHVPWLWRLHRMHHADLDIDVTTGARFHPLEIVLSLAIKMAAVAALGVPAEAVVIFEVLLNATSMFNHSNVALPPRLERIARWIVVTPQMHQVHHSIERAETDSNFGFNLPWWDRLFRTYRAAPRAGEAGLVIGLPIFRDITELRVTRLLTQPFRNAKN